MGVHKKPRAWKSYGFATSTWYFNLDWIHYLYEDTMFHTRWSDYLEISTQKKYSQKRALLYTPRQNTWKLYQKTFPPFWMQDDATSSEVGTLGGPDGNWQPRSSGSALTPCYNEMLFSFECLHPPWVEEWNLLPQLTVSSCVLFFRCCSVLILCYDHGTFIIVWFVCWNESIAYCCKFKKVTTFSSKVSIFLIENDFRAVNTNVIVDTCMLLGIYLLFFPAQLSIR